ncbi:LysE type translocator superfamily [Moritella sp. PE36]|uniref:LysE family translocator n=1 Tax=Moritella sp. PE36 TaxID=58051 RepID=UPI0001569A0F|nr:LysE family translocator [Moritella sp. PE36]EDM65762.1 LysE type translocator superfamily [Moritella sp. PE36]
MSLFIIWLSAMFPLVFSPGPANIVFAASGARVGVKRSIPLIMGVDTVFIIKSIIVGYGLGEVVQAYPNIMNVVQIVGALYLTFLAYKFVRSSATKSQNSTQHLGFIDGLLIQVLNSKGWLMVFLMFTLFTEQAQLTFGEHGILVLVIWLAMLNISIHFVWVKLGVLLANISSNKTYEQALNIFYASCLLVVSGWLIIDNQIWSQLI